MGRIGRTMPRGKERKQQINSLENIIRECFEKDMLTHDAAIKANCTLRTAQRWYKRFRE